MIGQPVQTLLVKQPTKFLGEVPSLGTSKPCPSSGACLTVPKWNQVFTIRRNQLA